MKLRNKGQAALEFLTTYGWAFLVILVMIGALSYFGVLDVSRFIPDSCKLDGNIECPAYALSEDTLQIQIRNNLADTVDIVEIKIKEKESSTWYNATVASGHLINASGSNPLINRGDQTDFNATLSSGAYEALRGKKKTFDLEVYFKKGNSQINNLAIGSLTTTVRE